MPKFGFFIYIIWELGFKGLKKSNKICHLKKNKLSEALCPPDDLPRRAGGVARSPGAEQTEMGLVELDRVDSRGRRWRKFCISGHEYNVNMSVLEPYLQVLSHGGTGFIVYLFVFFRVFANFVVKKQNCSFFYSVSEGSKHVVILYIILFAVCYVSENRI